MIKEPETWIRIEHLFRQIDFFLEQNTRRYLITKGLTNPRFILLVEVYFNPGLSLTELNEKMCVTISTVSNLTEQLVNTGLISRERRSDDRRLIELKLTREGHSLLEDVLKYRYGLIKKVVELMLTENVNGFIKFVEEFVSHI